MKLRPYQSAVIDKCTAAFFQGHKYILIQASTGAGKTVVASELINRIVAGSTPVLFLAHRKEIILQTSQKLDAFGVDHGVIMGNHPRKNDHLVQVATIQTISRRLKNLPPAGVMFIDEAHLSCGDSYKAMKFLYPDAVIIGLTATPTRTDGKGLSEIYSTIIECVPMAQLIEEGHLVKPRVFAPYTPDMKAVHISKGDYDATETAAVMDKPQITGDIIKHWIKYAQDRKTICFASSVQHSKNIVAEFVGAGISAKHLDATTPAVERDQTLHAWRDGKFAVLSNCGLFIEGLDVPAASCCILARPTKSLTIYLQAVGRVMRPAENKTDAIILDHAGLTAVHDFVDVPREWSLEPNPKKARASDNKEPTTSVTVCAECFCSYSKKLSPLACPECGAEVEQPEVAEVHAAGELIELTPELILAEAQRLEDAKAFAQALARKPLTETVTFADFINAGAAAGYKDYWAAKRWQERSMGVVYA
jgi:DNA repair protein RadD